ncbi:zinc ribbon domain-containing protein [Streptomyces sp. NBC_01320]|uniref:zinc ribbon domain-containing protein n=1 Tax=Streptomyces sp. NBC_01320 TaxID=2903824 RepID=UPI003FA3608D
MPVGGVPRDPERQGGECRAGNEGRGPRNTSRRCPECRHSGRGTGPQQSKFHCGSCGHSVHVDTMGARTPCGSWAHARRGSGRVPGPSPSRWPACRGRFDGHG